MEEFTAKLKADHGVFTLCDIVLNHTAFNTEWIKQQPDASYNCSNSPHLRPACVLDRENKTSKFKFKKTPTPTSNDRVAGGSSNFQTNLS